MTLNPVPGVAYDRDGPVAKCMPGTREAILTLINDWIDGGSDHPICWLHGPAGYGKSAIAQTVAEQCADSKKLAASFFFRRGAGDRSKIARFLPTLAYQLAHSLPHTKEHIQKALEGSGPLISNQSLRYQFKNLIIDPVLALKNPIDSMVFVIDALDECDDKDSIADFIDVLSCAIRDHRLPLRFFVTSRVEEHIRVAFDSVDDSSAIYTLSLQGFGADVDIRVFFQRRFNAIYKGRSRIRGEVQQPWPSDEVLDELVNKSSGSFIFAFTFVDFVSKQRGSLEANLQAALGTHTGLDELYRRVFPAAPRSASFERVIGTIMILKKFLSITELACLLDLESWDILDLLLEIQSVLVIPEDNGQPVQLVHTSLCDFLTTPTRSLDLYLDPPIRHLHITVDCLSALRQQPGEDVFYEGGQEYPCCNWLHHFRQGLIEGGGYNLLYRFPVTLVMSHLEGFASHSLDIWVNTVILRFLNTDIMDTLSMVLSILKVGIIHFILLRSSNLIIFQFIQICPSGLLQVLSNIENHARVKYLFVSNRI